VSHFARGSAGRPFHLSHMSSKQEEERDAPSDVTKRPAAALKGARPVWPHHGVASVEERNGTLRA
jgi:hypothetical protein